MIKDLKESKVNFVPENQRSHNHNQTNLFAVEMLKVESYHYQIEEQYCLGHIQYADKSDFDKIMSKVSFRIANYLELERTRILDYRADQILNIELEKFNDVYNQNPVVKFFGFYELSAKRVFLLLSEEELHQNLNYGVIKNVMFSNYFPYEV